VKCLWTQASNAAEMGIESARAMLTPPILSSTTMIAHDDPELELMVWLQARFASAKLPPQAGTAM